MSPSNVGGAGIDLPVHLRADDGRRLRPLLDALRRAGLADSSRLPARGGFLDLLCEFDRFRKWRRRKDNTFEPSRLWRVYRYRLSQTHPETAILHSLFVDGDTVSRLALERALEPPLIELATEVGLLRQTGSRLIATLRLYFFGDLVVFHDSPELRDQSDYAYIGRATSWMMGQASAVAHRTTPNRALDIGTGHGGVGLAIASNCAEVVGSDLDTRLLDLARANAAANGSPTISFRRSDVFDSVEGTYDLIAANSPQAIDESTAARHDRGAATFRQSVLKEGFNRLRERGALLYGFSTLATGRALELEEELRDTFAREGAAIELKLFMYDYRVAASATLRAQGRTSIARGIVTIQRSTRSSLRRTCAPDRCLWCTRLRARLLRYLALAVADQV